MQFRQLKQGLSSYDYFFYALVGLGIAAIVTSFPMMKLRYDLWDHVWRIREMVLDPVVTSPAKRYWYASWAFVFKLFEIDGLFTIAIVIHRVQFVANCIMIYIAARQLFEPLLSLNPLDKSQNEYLSSLALSSVLVWLVTIGTFSHIQQAWIMWYSVNYQITLVFLLLSIALTVNVLTVHQTKNVLIFKSIVAFVLLVLILKFHAGELAYFVFYAPIFLICFSNKLRLKKKYFFLGVVFIATAIYLGSKFYTDQIPALLTLAKNNDWAQITHLINVKGSWNVLEGGNRYKGNWNEMYALSAYTMLLLFALALAGLVKTNRAVMSFLTLSLVFCFAPSFVLSAGLLSLVSYDGIVNRYYFASYLFLAIPLLIYFIVLKFEKHMLRFNGKILLVLCGIISIGLVYSYSKFINNQGVFYQNVKSITASVKAKKLNVEISDEEIESIKNQIFKVEKTAATSSFTYCGGYEKIYVVYYLFNKKNVYFNRGSNISIAQCEEYAKKLGKYVIYIK